MSLRNFCGFSAFVYFLVQDFLDSAKAALSLISYHRAVSFRRNHWGFYSVTRTSALHDNLVLQVAYLLLICSVAGHHWLTMSPTSVERNWKFLFCRHLGYCAVSVCSKPLVISESLVSHGRTMAIHKVKLCSIRWLLFHNMVVMPFLHCCETLLGDCLFAHYSI